MSVSGVVPGLIYRFAFAWMFAKDTGLESTTCWLAGLKSSINLSPRFWSAIALRTSAGKVNCPLLVMVIVMVM